MTAFGQLAQRISAWTTRLLLCTLVLLAGWGFGRQVMQWWAAEPASSPGEGPAEGFPPEILAREPALVLSDQRWVMTWQGSASSREEALAMLRARCQPLAASAPLPAEPPGPAENRLLALLAHSVPVVEEAGRWSLFQNEGPLALVVGTRFVEAPGGAAATLGPAHRRVVVWGLAIPHGPEGWAIYAFHPAARTDAPGQTNVQ